jgi:hypothetical protein
MQDTDRMPTIWKPLTHISPIIPCRAPFWLLRLSGRQFARRKQCKIVAYRAVALFKPSRVARLSDGEKLTREAFSKLSFSRGRGHHAKYVFWRLQPSWPRLLPQWWSSAASSLRTFHRTRGQGDHRWNLLPGLILASEPWKPARRRIIWGREIIPSGHAPRLIVPA